MNSQGSNWLPSIGMPPLGFGVVMPQPTGSLHKPVMKNSNGNINDTQKTWQYQQYLLAQQGLSVKSDGIPVYPQQYFANTQQQQQWNLQQQRAAQGQKLLYEKFKKQQQFNEQKQRLQDFGSCKNKGTCSADIMIQNILSKDETSLKHRIGKKEHKFSCIEADDKNFNSTCTPPLAPNIMGPPSYQPTQLIQPSFPGLSNTCPLNALNSESCINSQVMPYYAELPSTTNSVNMDLGKKTNDSAINSNESSYPKSIRLPLQLPDWLNDYCNMPEVYKKACDIVESSHGWVDTSRAYMLLMKTNVPPHLLGVLWEMVNRMEPGRLQIAEFCGLLALVALIQNGKSFVDAEILKSTVSPVYPVIDHPALLALAQTECNQQQYIEANPVSFEPHSLLNVKPVSETFPEDDEFDDFVCAIPPPAIVNEIESVLLASNTSKPLQASPPFVHPAQLVHKSRTSDQERLLNFPSLGNSPLNHNKSCENKEADEFCDFQSANPADEVVLSLPAPYNANDKYAVFRELTVDELNSSDRPVENDSIVPVVDVEENDFSFGEFCCSEPALITKIPSASFTENNPNSGIGDESSINLINQKFVCSFNNESSKNDVNSINFQNDAIILSGNWAKDPFGEFEVSSKLNSITTDFSSDSSHYVTASASAETSSDPDDDFGDFIGPSEVTKVFSNLELYSSNHPDFYSETQSVASLELPGLEMTVNLSADPFKNELPQRSDDSAAFGQQFKSIEIPIAKCFEKEKDKPPVSVVIPESLPIADKYSIIRDVQQKERCFEEPHIESWKKCLKGSNKLLHDGLVILENIKDKKLLDQVLQTSQMQDYLLNLSEVHEVQLRIQMANQNMTTTNEIHELLKTSQDVWKSISTVVAEKLYLKVNSFQGSKDTTDDTICSLCLQNGGVSLLHGGLSYHPSCANLWLNIVDLTLPSLAHAKGSFL